MPKTSQKPPGTAFLIIGAFLLAASLGASDATGTLLWLKYGLVLGGLIFLSIGAVRKWGRGRAG